MLINHNQFKKAESEFELDICAQMMTNNNPWKMIGRTYEESLAKMHDPQGELYIAKGNNNVIGFIIFETGGPLSGFIRTVCVDSELRNSGIGTALIQFAERKISQSEDNVFLFVYSFNNKAINLYENLGYRQIAILEDYAVKGYSEILFRKRLQ